MISYAQNAEDVVLDRVLPIDAGFYVDVGAASPDASSVTRHFYGKGWRGINIDPRRDACVELRRRRPRDLNLQIAVGAEDGLTTFYTVQEDPDLSTIDPSDLGYLNARGYSYRAEEIQIKTLNSVLEMAEAGTIDFLKVDAEGAERDVLRGLDLQRWRPTVVVVEAIRPWSRDRTDAEWRDILESNGYVEGLFDGVNLYFAPSERPDILADLVPASAVDHYRTEEVVAMQRELDWHRGRFGLRVQPPPTPVQPADPAPAVTRLAVVGSPGAGNDRIAVALAGGLGCPVVAVAHPSQVPWRSLPRAVVIEMAAERTTDLEDRFRAWGVRAVSPARHPFDLLYAAYRRAHSSGPAPVMSVDGFVAWATTESDQEIGGMTAGWWSTPAAIRLRYEDLVADPQTALAGVVQRVHMDGRLEEPADGFATGPSVPDLGPEQRARLLEVYGDLLSRLGYR